MSFVDFIARELFVLGKFSSERTRTSKIKRTFVFVLKFHFRLLFYLMP